MKIIYRSPLTFAFTLLATSGCSVISLTASSVGSKVAPSLMLENRAHPQNSVLVHGFLERTPDTLRHNVLVVAATLEGDLASTVSVGESGMYSFFVPPGEYLISAFVDRNNDKVIEPSEIAGQTANSITVVAAEARAHIGVDVLFFDPRKEKPKFVDVLDEEINLDEGIPSLEPASDLFSGRFGDENIRRGSDESTTAFFNYAHPLQYLDEIDLTDGRTPIVFVHGINDSPRVFDRFNTNIPEGLFEALYYFYPTGARLPYAAQLLHHIFFSGKVLPTNQQMVLAAHSMGGLVARGSLNEFKGRAGESRIKLFASFATPYGGVNAANFATTSSPAIVPSWIDVASKSDFIHTLFQPLPPETTFDLCVANQFGNGDGTILLESQKAPKAVAQARLISEFPDSHVGITEDPAAIRQLITQATNLAGPANNNEFLRVEELGDGEHVPVGNLEKRRRAEMILNLILREAEFYQLNARVSMISPTLFRIQLIGPESTVILQTNAGEGLRFDIPTEPAPLLLIPWPSDGQKLEQTVLDVMNEAAKRLKATSRSENASENKSNVVPPASFPPQSTSVKGRKAPPFALGTGLSLNVDPGLQKFTLVTPFFMDMYLGDWGLGLDIRLTAFAPIHQTSTANIEYQPFYLLTGPRIRFGGADTLFTGKFVLNGGIEVGRMTLTKPGEPERFPTTEQLIRYDGLARFIATTGLALGVRIRPDFYAITQFEAGARPSPIDVDVNATNPVRFSGQIFGNFRLGIEVRVP